MFILFAMFSFSRIKSRSLLAIALLAGFIQTALAKSPSAAHYPTLGNPTSALETQDGRYVFVSVTNVGGPNFDLPDALASNRPGVVSGIKIFRRKGGKLRASGFIPLGGRGANGMAFLPGEKTLVIAVGDAGVAFLDVQDAIHGAAKPYFAAQGEGAGTFDVVVTPDGKYVFSVNEYGQFQLNRGNIGVTAVQADSTGRVTHPLTIGQIPAGNKAAGIAIAPDGSRVYVATEIVTADNKLPIAGTGNPILAKGGCVQRTGTPPQLNGYITIIDVQRAVTPGLLPTAVLSRVAAGCSPVRLVETADASTLFVSARGDNRILAFSPRLLDSDPYHAFQRALDSGGAAPVGIRLFDHDLRLAVSNSNRFTTSGGNIAILDISRTKGAALLRTMSAGVFPRNVTLSSDGRSLYLTDYTSRILEVLHGATGPSWSATPPSAKRTARSPEHAPGSSTSSR